MKQLKFPVLRDSNGNVARLSCWQAVRPEEISAQVLRS